MKIETVYTLKQPLSHIGESESTVSFLNTVRIAAGGKVQEVFALTGNAIRGTFRDCAARYLLDALNVRLKKKEFNILFSGGNIEGNLKTDIDQAKKYRELLPIISVFGAGVGNQILAGKMVQGFAYPVCLETWGVIPEIPGIIPEYWDRSWRNLTGTISFTRMDDTKNINYHKYIDGTETEEKEKDSASTQMRYEVEYLVPGAQLYHMINLGTEELVELGAFASALHEFSKTPILGGMGGKGFGLVDAVFYMDNGSEKREIAKIEDGHYSVSWDLFSEALNAYENHIESNKAEIIEFLGAVPNE